MQKLPQELLTGFEQRMIQNALAEPVRRDSLKWLRFYLDFCTKYRHRPEESESLQPFLQKLAQKRQSPEAQRQAAASVDLYHQLLAEGRSAPPKGGGAPAADGFPWETCHRKLKEEIRLRQYSSKTLQTYRTWIGQFEGFLDRKQPAEVDSDDARRFLTHLAVDRRVSASTQNQAFNALLFLYRHVLKVEYDLKDKVVRARRTKYVPVVLSREEIDAVLEHLRGARKLAVQLLYGCGLRLFEGLNLRVHCFNLTEAILTVHDGKGRKDRTVPLPRSLMPAIEKQMDGVRRLHEQDLREGYDGVFMPFALDRKWRNASKELIWQWFFPAKTLTWVPRNNERRRYHMHQTSLQKSLQIAVRKSGVPKRITCHTFRHSFASHLLQANYDIRTIQQMLGHSDVRTTMIYTNTVKSRTVKEQRSPLDLPAEIFS